MPSSAREFAEANIIPLIHRAKTLGIAARWTAISSGYSEQAVYKLWSRTAA